MKLYQISYRKDEWVTVIAGFAEDVDVDNIDSVATAAVCYGLLNDYVSSSDNQISELTVEVEEYDEGDPDVVIFADEIVMSGDDYRISQITAKQPIVELSNLPTK